MTTSANFKVENAAGCCIFFGILILVIGLWGFIGWAAAFVALGIAMFVIGVAAS